jgi:CBS domain-containing protein
VRPARAVIYGNFTLSSQLRDHAAGLPSRRAPAGFYRRRMVERADDPVGPGLEPSAWIGSRTEGAKMMSRRAGRASEDRVDAVMHRGLISCSGATLIAEVGAEMARHSIHCVVVADAGGPAAPEWGIVSDLDLMAAVAAGDTHLTAGEISGSPSVEIAPGATLEDAARMMVEHHASHLLVREPGAARPIGVISSLDVAGGLGATAAREPA